MEWIPPPSAEDIASICILRHNRASKVRSTGSCALSSSEHMAAEHAWWRSYTWQGCYWLRRDPNSAPHLLFLKQEHDSHDISTFRTSTFPLLEHFAYPLALGSSVVKSKEVAGSLGAG